MEAVNKTMSYSWVWLLAVLLFFFNSLSFTGGVTLTLLLTPLWLYLLREWSTPHDKLLLLPPVLVLAGYAMIHAAAGVIASYYIVSTIILIATLCFALVAYKTICRYHETMDVIFRHLLILNFVFMLISLGLLFFPAFRDITWYTISISRDIEPIPRLKLFTVEASHYSFLLAPLVIYFLSRMLFFKATNPLTTLILILLPLALSFSLGVILCLVLTGVVVLALWFRKIFFSRSRKQILILTLLGCASLLIILYVIYPDNPLYHRIFNILSNKDTSARGRTYESFILAHKIAGQKSYLFGAGPGQLKVIGRDIIIQFYRYVQMPPVVRIPNACADTLVCYGYTGLALRLLLQIFLFFITGVFYNPFRVWLFLFLFLYQFTGSFITNAPEYLLWALVFAPVFPDFNKHHLSTDRL